MEGASEPLSIYYILTLFSVSWHFHLNPILTHPFHVSLLSDGVGKSWGETLEELAKDIAARLPPQFDIERALILFPVR